MLSICSNSTTFALVLCRISVCSHLPARLLVQHCLPRSPSTRFPAWTIRERKLFYAHISMYTFECLCARWQRNIRWDVFRCARVSYSVCMTMLRKHTNIASKWGAPLLPVLLLSWHSTFRSRSRFRYLSSGTTVYRGEESVLFTCSVAVERNWAFYSEGWSGALSIGTPCCPFCKLNLAIGMPAGRCHVTYCSNEDKKDLNISRLWRIRQFCSLNICQDSMARCRCETNWIQRSKLQIITSLPDLWPMRIQPRNVTFPKNAFTNFVRFFSNMSNRQGQLCNWIYC